MKIEDVALPALADDRVDEMEEALFAAIASERDAAARQRAVEARRRRARRGRWWMGGAAAAAVVIVAAVIGPQLAPRGEGAGSTADEASAPHVATEDAPGDEVGMASEGDAPTDADLAREIIATASASLRVEDASAAAREIGEAAEAAGGYVETVSIAGEGRAAPEVIAGDGQDAPGSASGTWITVRVPAGELAAQTRALAEVGEVTSSQLDRRDVTAEAVDLRARIRALEASVTRLTDLMADAGSTTDLLSAESALAQRQAELESYQQQLAGIEDDVAMSTLTVTLYEPQEVAAADPAGFGDGLAAGWSGLIATLNAVVIGLGFLLPWLGIALVAGLIVWAVRSALRRGSTGRRSGTASDAQG